MADSQVPWGVNALGGMISEAAWRLKPSWYLVVTDDRMIPPPAQRAMAERTGATVTEVPGSHSIYVSQPQARRLAHQAGRRLTPGFLTTWCGPGAAGPGPHHVAGTGGSVGAVWPARCLIASRVPW